MKKVLVLLGLFLSLGAYSQEVKIAHVNTNEVFSQIPGLTEAELEIAAITEKYQNELKTLQDEFQVKYEEYMKIRETLLENIRLRREQELTDLQDRLQNYYSFAQEEMQKEQARILTPLQEKLINAIKEVGAEQGYTHIFEEQQLLFVGDKAIDATPLVKAKLGIR